MIIILRPDIPPESPEVDAILAQASRIKNITTKVHAYRGEHHTLTEVHLIGETKSVPVEAFSEQPGVVRVVRVSEKYRLIGRHEGQLDALGFEYRGIRFGQ